MPILASSAYNTAEDVLIRLRTILNDSEVAGGDVIADTAVFAFDLINAGYEQVQSELITVGDETFTKEGWILSVPLIATIDPEARVIIDDTGCSIIYPNGVGNSFAATPRLPDDLVVPLKLWERPHGSTDSPSKMNQPNGGLFSNPQSQFLTDWEWKTDGLRLRGATQIQDVKILYGNRLNKLAAPTDPVPIRGVVNAAAYFAALIFCTSRGGIVAPSFKIEADADIFRLKTVLARRNQRKQVRRQPYSGRGLRSS